VRGEGGHLKLPLGVPGGGERFMPRFDPREDLAPRDIVARAMLSTDQLSLSQHSRCYTALVDILPILVA
jgi:aspartate oxidase